MYSILALAALVLALLSEGARATLGYREILQQHGVRGEAIEAGLNGIKVEGDTVKLKLGNGGDLKAYYAHRKYAEFVYRGNNGRSQYGISEAFRRSL